MASSPVGLRISSSLCAIARRCFAVAASQNQKTLGACVLERLPVVVPHDSEWEVEHQQWLQQFQQRFRKAYPPEFLEGQRADAAEGSADGGWQPAPRVTEADRAHDTKSVNRKLDQRLFLLVKATGEDEWRFPEAECREGETIRECAERALSTAAADSLSVYFVGNAPCGHTPSSESTRFFVKAQLLGGDMVLQEGSWSDFAWAANDELAEYVSDEQSCALMRDML